MGERSFLGQMAVISTYIKPTLSVHITKYSNLSVDNFDQKVPVTVTSTNSATTTSTAFWSQKKGRPLERGQHFPLKKRSKHVKTIWSPISWDLRRESWLFCYSMYYKMGTSTVLHRSIGRNCCHAVIMVREHPRYLLGLGFWCTGNCIEDPWIRGNNQHGCHVSSRWGIRCCNVPFPNEPMNGPSLDFVAFFVQNSGIESTKPILIWWYSLSGTDLNCFGWLTGRLQNSSSLLWFCSFPFP